jgi:signal transduction histidine kinase/CheY-like chemotaxis protein
MRAIPLAWMVTGVIGTTVVLVAGSFALFAVQEFRETRQREFGEAERTAQLVAMFAAVDVMFDAREQAAKDLTVLRGHPDMEAAWLYDRTGKSFAVWRRSKVPEPPALRPHKRGSSLPTARLIGDEYIEIQTQIGAEDTQIGTLQLLVSARQMHQRFHSVWVMLVTIGVEMLVWTAVIAVLLQWFVARPTLKMAATAVDISKTGNYSLRLDARGGPELMLLTEGFNNVLAAVEQRERQRDQAEAALLESPVGIAIECVSDRRVRFVNEAMVRLMGKPSSELVGHLASEVGLPDGNLEGVPRPGERTTIRDLERVLHTPTGERHVALFTNLIRYGGEPCRVTYFYDITERRQLDAIRRQVEIDEVKRLQEASRAKSAFLANMSHELRTPLNAIIGFGELLEGGEVGPIDPQQKEFLGDIVSSGRHLLTLISDILDVSKVEAGKMEFRPEKLDLSRACTDAIDVLRGQLARKRIRLTCAVNPAVATVTLDPSRLKQVLYNLLSNALKFSPEGSEVSLMARPAGETRFRLEITDAGPGIRAEDMPMLFREFQQLDDGAGKHHAGTGLGLALVKHLVEAQGGTVGVQSEPGHGSTFYAELPRDLVDASVKDAPVMSALLMPRADAPCVLVVEPDVDEAGILLRALVVAGYGVQLAGAGAIALDRLKAHAFSAVAMSTFLPDAQVGDVLAAIRQIPGYARSPVVLTTATLDVPAEALAVHEVLLKPVSTQALLSSLARAGVLPLVAHKGVAKPNRRKQLDA